MANDINVKLCCNNLVSAIKTKTVKISEGEFCLGETEYKLKEPTVNYDTAIIKIDFCPWCGMHLKRVTDEIKSKIAEVDKEEIEKTK